MNPATEIITVNWVCQSTQLVLNLQQATFAN